MKANTYRLKIYMESYESRANEIAGKPVMVENLVVRMAEFYERPLFISEALDDDGIPEGTILYFVGTTVQSPLSMGEVSKIINNQHHNETRT